MKRFKLSRILNPDTMVPLLRWVCWPAIGVYFASMVVVPVIQAGPQWWENLQAVWDRWQGLNIGMLALIASVIAFETTRYSEDRQRSREFMAARAFLPGALSELTAYLKASARVHIACWENSAISESSIPADPTEYREAFANCIRHAEPEIGEVLSSMLAKLQVQEARLRELLTGHRTAQVTIYWYLLSLAELQALVNKLFDFARGEADFDASPLTWDEFHNAYRNLGIHVGEYELNIGKGERIDLETSTKRAIARARGEKEPKYEGQRSDSP